MDTFYFNQSLRLHLEMLMKEEPVLRYYPTYLLEPQQERTCLNISDEGREASSRSPLLYCASPEFLLRYSGLESRVSRM